MIRAHHRAVDVLVITLLSASILVDPPAGRGAWVQAVALAGLTLPLLWRRRHPVVMTAVVVTAAWVALLGQVWQQRLPLAHLALEIMLYTLVVRGRRRPAAVAAAATVGFGAVWASMWYAGAEVSWGIVGSVLSVATAWLLAEYLRARRAYLDEVERRARLADSERDALARAAVAEERAHIARELHDTLAHTIGVMVVNAEGALLMRHQDPAVVQRTLEIVSSTGRTALVELRRLLAVLDASDPLPGSAVSEDDLRQLVDRAGSAGTTSVLHLSGTSDALPASAMAQVYRITQEALTNVVKHAGPDAAVDVTIDLGRPARRRTVRVDVCNTGADRDGPAPPLPSSGRGLKGVGERVALFGGTLHAGATPGGGFRLTATLPIDGELSGLSQSDPATMG
ncbi:histidine kinase [Actinoplanes sp. NPDC049548]|uniref:sensor histidine kinase n=1 Tax=Actinoplanes sp. NPDC049548 TaxID=3155152 RepID=UPI00342E715C